MFFKLLALEFQSSYLPNTEVIFSNNTEPLECYKSNLFFPVNIQLLYSISILFILLLPHPPTPWVVIIFLSFHYLFICIHIYIFSVFFLKYVILKFFGVQVVQKFCCWFIILEYFYFNLVVERDFYEEYSSWLIVLSLLFYFVLVSILKIFFFLLISIIPCYSGEVNYLISMLLLLSLLSDLFMLFYIFGGQQFHYNYYFWICRLIFL